MQRNLLGALARWLVPDFFIYQVKPEPKSDSSATYLVMFSSPQKMTKSKRPEPDQSPQKLGRTHLSKEWPYCFKLDVDLTTATRSSSIKLFKTMY
jgi:hypothetical protein